MIYSFKFIKPIYLFIFFNLLWVQTKAVGTNLNRLGLFFSQPNKFTD